MLLLDLGYFNLLNFNLQTGFAVLCAGLAIRIVITYIGTSHNDLTWKEKLFVAIAWLPKATVQAAIGSIALDTARLRGSDPNDIYRGNVILTIAVLGILITAPLGAALIVGNTGASLGLDGTRRP